MSPWMSFDAKRNPSLCVCRAWRRHRPLIGHNADGVPSGMSNDYPKSISELDLDAVQISPAILTAVKRFAASKPYRGSTRRRIQKFSRAIRDICDAAGVERPRLLFVPDERQDSGRSACIPALRTIILRGRLSVITCLHEVSHLLNGPSEHVACAWSLRLFRDCFPRSWSRLRFDGHVAIVERDDT
jgi:hypothetical protein